MRVLFAHLAAHQHRRGLDHVTSKRLAEDLPYSSHQLGPALVLAEEFGWVTRVTNSTPYTYRIRIADPDHSYPYP